MSDLKEIVSSLPLEPGVYRFFDKDENLIYVGKAKKLKNRVSSYFTNINQHSTKTLRLVKQIKDIQYTVVDSELDALLLENSLIKQNQPKYNILLKDDKTYPYISILRERFPRIISTRTLERKNGIYFGPYSNVRAMNYLLELFQKLFQLRTCNFNLSEENVKAGKYESCLEYHIGNCKAPCIGQQAEAEYEAKIQQAKAILKGDLKPAKDYLQGEMLKFAEELQFEKAQKVKGQLELLLQFESKSVVSNPKLLELEVFSITSSETESYINYLKVQNGIITISKNDILKKKLDETDEEVLLYYIVQTLSDITTRKKHILSNVNLEVEHPNFEFVKPEIGDKKRLVDLSYKNALTEKLKKDRTATPDRAHRVLAQIQTDFRLKTLPKHIECFDNSNIQGTNPVASMVCFRMGKPSKKDYRHYNIKTVVGPDDFSSMKEVVGRRYKRLLEENVSLPDLIVIDGGKGQLSSAYEALQELGVEDKVTVVGIAKRLEEIFYPKDQYPLYISKKSESLKVIQHLRNEAHRFAITFHRNQRSKNFIKNELEEVKGIGPATIKLLLQTYRTPENIKNASRADLEKLIGVAKTKILLAYFEG